MQLPEQRFPPKNAPLSLLSGKVGYLENYVTAQLKLQVFVIVLIYNLKKLPLVNYNIPINKYGIFLYHLGHNRVS